VKVKADLDDHVKSPPPSIMVAAYRLSEKHQNISNFTPSASWAD
jgi:hypothetical protein